MGRRECLESCDVNPPPLLTENRDAPQSVTSSVLPPKATESIHDSRSYSHSIVLGGLELMS